MKVICPKCLGRRNMTYWYDDKPGPPLAGEGCKPTDMAVTGRLEECRTCKGKGEVEATEPIPVYQSGRLIGTVPPNFDPRRIRSTNWMYNPRPGDFTREGDTWVAARGLGPGDLEAVPGFVWDRSRYER